MSSMMASAAGCAKLGDGPAGTGGTSGMGGASGSGGAGGIGGGGGTGGMGGTGRMGGVGGTGGTTKPISVACTNSFTPEVAVLDWNLTVTPEPIESGEPFTAALDGLAVFSEEFLDTVQDVILGGVKKANLVDLQATVHVRSGASGADIVLVGEPLDYECALDATPCNPDNDVPSIPGVRGNTDCDPVVNINQCGRFVELPNSNDCAPEGICADLGKWGPGSQCDLNDFCITGDLPLPLEGKTGSYTAEATGTVLFGWDDQKTGATVQPDGPNEGTYNLPPTFYADPTGWIGLRTSVVTLGVGLDCTMAVDSGGPDGVGVPDLSSPTPNSALIAFPIETP